MEIMEGVHLYLLLLLVTLIQGIQGQAVTPSSVFVAVEDDVSLECTTTTETPGFSFSWVNDAGVVIYSGGTKQPPPGEYDHFDLNEDTTAKRSTLIITNILRQDEGEYRCTVTGQTAQDPATVSVEVGSPSPSPPIVLASIDGDSNYQATCEAIGSSPAETITWILDGDTQPDGDHIVERDPQESDDTLFDIESVFTFPATPENYEVQLECNIGGHQVAKLNRNETRLVDIHKRPQSGDIIIDFAGDGAEFTVSCDDTNSAAVPAMNTFNFYYNGTPIAEAVSDNTVTFTEPEYDTEFRCEGSNYLGSTNATETFYPGRPTTPSPTTEPITTEGNTTTPSGVPATQPSTTDNIDVTDPPIEDPSPGTTNIGPIIGGVVGAIVVIVIIVIAVCYCKKEERYCFEAGGTKSSGSSKPAGSAVGSSNGSERDVESPLNGVKDVTAEEKTKPEAAPRGHGSIQHTNDNPNQDMYAMVDKKPSGGRGGDAPDRGSGPGQNEPQGMLYADLDLSHKAGHTDKHVPKNENDVVVYSSILV